MNACDTGVPAIAVHKPAKYTVRYLHQELSSLAQIRDLIASNQFYANSRDDNDCIPLHYAKSAEIAEALLSYGASVAATDGNYYDPRVFAHYSNILFYLKDMGVYKRDRTIRGLIPLHYAVASDNVALVEFLLLHGSDINDQDNELRLAPIHFAHSIEMVSVLLANRANIDCYNVGKQTVVHMAVSRLGIRVPIIRYVIDCFVNSLGLQPVPSGLGGGPVLRSALSMIPPIQQSLSDSSLSVAVAEAILRKDDFGFSPIQYVKSVEILELLLDYHQIVMDAKACASVRSGPMPGPPRHVETSPSVTSSYASIPEFPSDVPPRPPSPDDAARSTHLNKLLLKKYLTFVLHSYVVNTERLEIDLCMPLAPGDIRATTDGNMCATAAVDTADSNVIDNGTVTISALTLPCGDNSIDMISYLVGRGADLLAPFTAAKSSVLHVVKNAHICQQLCRHGAAVNVLDAFKYTPLHYARNKDIARCLLEHGALINASFNNVFPLLSIAEPLTLEFLLGWHGSASSCVADLNDATSGSVSNGSSISSTGDSGDVSVISSGGDTNLCAVLVQQDDPGLPTHSSFLWRNYKNAQSGLIQLKLLQYYHDVLGYQHCPELQCPLHYARTEEVISYLFMYLDGRAMVHQRSTIYQYEPLHQVERPEVVEMLCEAGADVNSLDKYDNSPLHCVRNAETFIALCERGANLTLTNTEGHTPLDWFINQQSLRSTTRAKAALMRYFFWKNIPMQSLVRTCNWNVIHDKSAHFQSITRQLVSQRFMRFVCGFDFLSLTDVPIDITSLEQQQKKTASLLDADTAACVVFSNEALCNLMRQF